jgi:RimJ/RimL family protein N-acetyltransferase
MFPERVDTERLRLVRLCRANFDPVDLYRYYSSQSDTVDEETAHLTWDPHETPKETWDAVVDAERRWDDGEAATYALVPRDGEDGAGEFAGTTDFDLDWEKRTAIFAVWLRKPFWGRGYSGERAAALLALAFDHLDLELVSAGYLSGNENSRRAIEKYVERFGGRYDGILRNWVPMDGAVRDLHRYTVTREQWERNRDAGPDVTIPSPDG